MGQRRRQGRAGGERPRRVPAATAEAEQLAAWPPQLTDVPPELAAHAQQLPPLRTVLGNRQLQRLATTHGSPAPLQPKSKPTPTAGAGTPAAASGSHALEVRVTSPRGDWIGHAWVVIEDPEGNEEAYGFYPKEAGLLEFLGARTEGKVTNDSGRGDATNSVRYEITLEQYEQVRAYIEGFEGQDYDLYEQNCTHFAIGAARAADIEPPRAGWLLPWPDGLERGMQARQQAWQAEAEDLGLGPQPVPAPTPTPAPGG
jgi:hypothetical protein